MFNSVAAAPATKKPIVGTLRTGDRNKENDVNSLFNSIDDMLKLFWPRMGQRNSESPVDEATDGGPQANENSGKPFEVVACVWASAPYATRGEESILSLRRLHFIAFRNGWSLLSLWASAIFLCTTIRQPM